MYNCIQLYTLCQYLDEKIQSYRFTDSLKIISSVIRWNHTAHYNFPEKEALFFKLDYVIIKSIFYKSKCNS